MIKKIFQFAMILQGILWIYLGCQSTSISGDLNVTIAALMFLNAVLFIGFALIFHKTRRTTILAGIFIGGNLLLTVTDQMGVFDYIVLTLNLLCIVLFLIYAFNQKKA